MFRLAEPSTDRTSPVWNALKFVNNWNFNLYLFPLYTAENVAYNFILKENNTKQEARFFRYFNEVISCMLNKDP